MDAHFKVLKAALEITKERGQTYDTTGSGVEDNFARAAGIASLWLNRKITARDVALIMASVKMARIAVAPSHEDSYVDLVNYVSFGAAFSVPKTNGRAAEAGVGASAAVSSLNQKADLNQQAYTEGIENARKQPLLGPGSPTG